MCRRKENKTAVNTVKCVLNQKRDFKYGFRDVIFKMKPKKNEPPM